MGLAFRCACLLLLLLAIVYPTATLLSHDASMDQAFDEFQSHAPSHPLVQQIDLNPSHTKHVANGNLLVQHLPRQEPPRHTTEWWLWCSQHPEQCAQALQKMNHQDIHQRDSDSPDPDYHEYCRYHPGLQMCQSAAIEQRQFPHDYTINPRLPVCNTLSLQERQSWGLPRYCLHHPELPECHPGVKRRALSASSICQENPESPTCHANSIEQRRPPRVCDIHPELEVCQFGVKEIDFDIHGSNYCLQYPERPECHTAIVKAREPAPDVAANPESRINRYCEKQREVYMCRCKLHPEFSWCRTPLEQRQIEDGADDDDWEHTMDEYEALYEDWYNAQLRELIEWQNWLDFQEWQLEPYGNFEDPEDLAERSDTQYPEPEHVEHFVSRSLPRPTHSPRPLVELDLSARMVPTSKPRPKKPPMEEGGKLVGPHLNQPAIQTRGRRNSSPDGKSKPYNSPRMPPGPPVSPKLCSKKSLVKEDGAIAHRHSITQLSLVGTLIPPRIARLFTAESEHMTEPNGPGNNSTQQPASSGTTAPEDTLFSRILLYVLLGLICFGILSLAVFIAARRFMRNSSWTPREDCSDPLAPTKLSPTSGDTVGERGAYGSVTGADEEAQRPMMQRYSGTGLDGVNDGWTKWIQHRRGVEVGISQPPTSSQII